GANSAAITSDAALRPSADVRKAYAFPSWSHDNQRVAFVGVSSENDGTAILYTAAVKDAKPLQLFRSEHEFPFYLSWSPDSKSIAYINTQGSGSNVKAELHLIKPDGSGDQLLSDESPIAFFWSPDGARIAYLVRARGDQGSLQTTLNSEQQGVLHLT